MACWTVVIFSAASSGISHSNSSSSAITSSTLSSESAPRSSTKDDSFLMSASATPSCSATIFLTRASRLSIEFLHSFLLRFHCKKADHSSTANGRDFGQKSPLIHVHAAIHVQRRPGHVGGRRRAQEKHGLRDIVDAPEPSQRNVLDQFLHLLLGERARHVGFDESRGHTVHRDAAASHLARERLGESDH